MDGTGQKKNAVLFHMWILARSSWSSMFNLKWAQRSGRQKEAIRERGRTKQRGLKGAKNNRIEVKWKQKCGKWWQGGLSWEDLGGQDRVSGNRTNTKDL